MASPVDIAQPAVTVTEITDPAAAGAGIELLDLNAMQLQSMPLRARRVIVRLESAAVVFHSTNLRLRTRTRFLAGRLAYVTYGPQTEATANGLPLRSGVLLVVQPETEVQFVVNAGYEGIVLMLPPEDIRAHLAARQREADFRVPRGVETLQANGEKIRALFDWGKRLVDTAARQPELFNESREQRLAAQVELLETLLATPGETNGFEADRSDRTRQAHSRIVKAAEDHALSKPGDRLFDKFHIMRHLGEALDKVRKAEYARLSGRDRSFIKGQKYTLLSHRENLTPAGRQNLKKLLAANKRLNTAYLLKESFGQLWDYQREGWARRFFDNWRASLKWQRLKPYEKFAEMVERHWDGIATYCRPENKVSLGFVEGLNNKIRVIQRRAYGLRDEEYLRLKILTCMLPEL